MILKEPSGTAVVELSVLILAPPLEVWRAIVDPDVVPRWLGGFRLVSSWEVGSPFAIRGTLNEHEYEETGTVLASEPGALLRYDHWSRLWRKPDLPENRAVLEMRLEPVAAGTELFFKHELPAVKALAEHSQFFWRGRLNQLKKLLEHSEEGQGDAGA